MISSLSHSSAATASDRSTTPVAAATQLPSKSSGPGSTRAPRLKRSAISAWLAARTLTPHVHLVAAAGDMFAAPSKESRIVGGSRDRDESEVAVTPNQSAPRWKVTTLTARGNCRKASRYAGPLG